MIYSKEKNGKELNVAGLYDDIYSVIKSNAMHSFTFTLTVKPVCSCTILYLNKLVLRFV